MIRNPRRQHTSQNIVAAQTDSTDRFLTAKDAAEFLGEINPRTLSRRAREGQTPAYPGRLLNDNEAAEQLGVSPATLRSWRCRGIGPNYVKMGSGKKSAVRYSASDIDQFIAQCRQVPFMRPAFGE
jgi:predicted DNA-binding transcriptional regulator AlpA